MSLGDILEPVGWRPPFGHAAPVDGRPGTFLPDFVVIHHTVGIDDTGIDSIETLVTGGREGIPGPLYQVYVDHGDADIVLVSEGKANHAGLGDPAVYAAVTTDTPRPAPLVSTMSGNRWAYGIGLEGPPHTQEQYHAAVEVAALICVDRGWHADRVIGHREWTNRKVDPVFDMSLFRGFVERRVREMGLTPEQEADLAWVAELRAELTAREWTTGTNTAVRLDYVNDLRNEMAAKAGTTGDRADLIAAEYWDRDGGVGTTPEVVQQMIATHAANPDAHHA